MFYVGGIANRGETAGDNGEDCFAFCIVQKLLLHRTNDR